MTEQENEAREPLESTAIQVTAYHRLIVPDCNESNRSNVVLSLEADQGVVLRFRGDGIVIFDFSNAPEYQGGAVPAWKGQNAPPTVQETYRCREKLVYKRSHYINAYLCCFISALK